MHVYSQFRLIHRRGCSQFRLTHRRGCSVCDHKICYNCIAEDVRIPCSKIFCKCRNHGIYGCGRYCINCKEIFSLQSYGYGKAIDSDDDDSNKICTYMKYMEEYNDNDSNDKSESK